MRTAVIAIAKMENNYVREWVEHYIHLGFTNVIIYDNNDKDGEHFEDVIGDYINCGYVILEDFRGMYPGHSQAYAYQSGYDKYGGEYDWIAFFDIDEFLMLNEKFDNNIENYLSMDCFSKADIIRVSWREYGDNGHVRVINGDYSLVKRFTEPYTYQRKWTKAILRGGIDNLTIPKSGDGQAHLVRINAVKSAVGPNGEQIRNDIMKIGFGYENAVLNHYSYKTIEEYVLNKKKKGYCEGADADKVLTMDAFFNQNERTKEKEDLYNELTSKEK